MQVFLFALSVNIIFYSIVFIICKICKKHSLIDVFWGLSFVNLCWILLLTDNDITRSDLVLVTAITIWGVRLSGHLFLRNAQAPEDYRYLNIVNKLKQNLTSIPLFIKEYVYIYLMQAGLSFIISLVFIFYFMLNKDTSTLFLVLGVLVIACGFYFEFLGDYQLDQFKKQQSTSGKKLIDTGLWSISRHPNYFGEILVWYGIFLVCFSSYYSLLMIISPLAINYLIVNISGVPLLEEKLKLRPGYEDYIAKTNKLIPWRKK